MNILLNRKPYRMSSSTSIQLEAWLLRGSLRVSTLLRVSLSASRRAAKTRSVRAAEGAKQMRTSDFGRYALGFCAAAVMLSGCGGLQPPIGPGHSF